MASALDSLILLMEETFAGPLPKDSHREKLRRSQLRSINNLTVVMVICNLLLASVFLWQARSENSFLHLLGWSVGLVGIMIPLVIKRIKSVRGSNDISCTLKSIRSVVHYSFMLGCMWGLAVPLLSAMEGTDVHLTLIVGFVALIAAGTAALAAIPLAVFVFVVPVGLGGAIGLQLQNTAANVISLSVLLGFVTISAILVSTLYARLFANHVGTLTQAREQNSIIGMLLNEFEENSSDWLWETNSEGRLVRFPQAFEGIRASDTERGMIEYLRSVVVIEGEHLNEIKSALASQKAFKRVALCVGVDSEERWWTFSGHPIVSEDGQFTGFIGTGSDITAEKLAEQRIDRLAHSNALTGLMNRGAFNQRLQTVVANLERYGRPFCILYMDLDNFKLVNDTRGHLLGDRLLAEVGDRISEPIREGDCVARLGGDEFAVIMESQGDAGVAAHLCARLISEVQKPYQFEGEELKIGLSIGIAIAPLHGTRPDQIVRNADLALYRAKADGRGVFRFFESEMDSELRERRMLEMELRDAVANNELVLHFQPLVDASSRKPLGMEALVRWNHPLRGILGPNQFISIADNTQLICEMGVWSIREACHQALDWPKHLYVSVNLSAHHFMRADIVKEVKTVLDELDFPAERLELEITESLLINTSEDVLIKLKGLSDLGVQVAMDDFGTGYSSLSYLMDVPFDKLKIDQSFVSAVGKKKSGDTIVRMITALARELDLLVTAEGVETEEQADFLEQVNCHQLQGYYFSRPMPTEDLAAYFLKEAQAEVKSSEQNLLEKLPEKLVSNG